MPAIAWPFSTPVAAGVAFSTVGAGLQSLVGAPMLLQTMAEDRTLPFLACIADRPTEKQKQLVWRSPLRPVFIPKYTPTTRERRGKRG